MRGPLTRAFFCRWALAFKGWRYWRACFDGKACILPNGPPWRRQYRSGALTALTDNKRGRKQAKNPLEEEVSRLQRENTRLARRLEQAETIIEIPKKVSSMQGIPLMDDADEGNG